MCLQVLTRQDVTDEQHCYIQAQCALFHWVGSILYQDSSNSTSEEHGP
jgi:hypothetical protein